MRLLLELQKMLESPLDMPEGADMVKKLETLMARLEATKKALGIANKLTTPEDRRYHRSRIMKTMNQLRSMFNKTADEMEAELKKW